MRIENYILWIMLLVGIGLKIGSGVIHQVESAQEIHQSKLERALLDIE